MPESKKILELIFEAVGELNERLPEKEWLEKSKDTPLTGKSAKLDSLKLVSLIVATEQKVQEEFNATVTIANERILDQKESPLRTIETLADFISMLVQESATT